jgi:divalent metal cation (Fe/Co/Zn/Cd) transporter
MHRVYGIVLFIAGTAFLLLGGYLLYTGYMSNGAENWQNILFAAGVCLFGYLLSIAGYRMSREERL